MIIKFGKIELSDWEQMGEYYYRRAGIQNSPYVKLQPIWDETGWLVHFYNPLAFLHHHFPVSIKGDINFTKDCVDKFLIRMSGLAAFI
jgi:hypothetical protein